ncbi:MAG: prenyltransferase/squalene oxidase repeat-containing protein [Candidatus Thorarchaeota archaeon]
MTEMNKTLNYNVQNYVLENGSIADVLRLNSAGYDIPQEQVTAALDGLKTMQNRDGGLPFDLVKGNPSSVKITSEILPLIAKYRETHSDFFSKMVTFLISRQKKDGGFAETLNLDPYIEDKFGMTWGREWYPVGKSITWLTGKALEALCIINYDDQERLRRARDFLLYSQNEDGHWPDYKERDESDPLGTGNILPALLAVGVSDDHKVYQDGRAAVLQHLASAIDTKSVFDMVDLVAVGKPVNDKEREVISEGLKLVKTTQSTDGGWIPEGAKKSDPELSSILAFVYKKCHEY